MSDIVHCNKEQAEKILTTYFAHKPIITRVSKDDKKAYILCVILLIALIIKFIIG